MFEFRRSRALLACALLLLHALLPVLHQGMHLVEARDHQPCSVAQGVAGERIHDPGDASRPVLRQGDLAHDDCGLCVALDVGRNLIPTATASVVAPAYLRAWRLVHPGSSCSARAFVRPPPVRGPPVLQG